MRFTHRPSGGVRGDFLPAQVSASPKTRRDEHYSHSLSLNGAPSLVESTVNDLNGDPGTQPDRKWPLLSAPALSFPPVIREHALVSSPAVISVRMQPLARPSVSFGHPRPDSENVTRAIESG